MDTLLKNRILYSLSHYSLSVSESNAIHGFLHNHFQALTKITDVLEDIIYLEIIELSDIPNIILLLATVFQETAIKSDENPTDPEILFLLIKVTAFCILDMDPKTRLYTVHLPTNDNDNEQEKAIVIDSMVNTCLELLQMQPIVDPPSPSISTSIPPSNSKRKCWHWFS